MKASIIVSICILILVLGCKKTESYKDIPDEYKNYFLFSEGSNWVYNNLTTGITDSIVLRRINKVSVQPDNICDKYRYEYNIQLTNVTNSKIYNCKTTCVGNASISDGITSAIFTVPPSLPTLYVDTVIADSTLYFHVIVYYYFNDTMSVYSAYARNIGRIKCYYSVNGSTLINYELKRYHVAAYE